MGISVAELYRGVKPEEFRSYLRPGVRPPLDTQALSLHLMEGDERRVLKSLTCGTWSLVLKYREREAYVASLQETQQNGLTNLEVVQLQGATGKGYRVATGMHV